MLYRDRTPNFFCSRPMNKDAILLGVCLVALAGGGGYHFYANQHLAPPALVGKLTPVDAAHPKPAAAANPAPQKKATAAEQQAAAQAAAHAQIQTALGGMKVSSILLGDPAAVIISKKDYSVGDSLQLAGPPAKALTITGINEDGVTLAADGQTYHLDAPAAPDLAASRKK